MQVWCGNTHGNFNLVSRLLEMRAFLLLATTYSFRVVRLLAAMTGQRRGLTPVTLTNNPNKQRSNVKGVHARSDPSVICHGQ